jgi:hypothetical protein
MTRGRNYEWIVCYQHGNLTSMCHVLAPNTQEACDILREHVSRAYEGTTFADARVLVLLIQRASTLVRLP